MKRFLKWFAAALGVIIFILAALFFYAYFIEPRELNIYEETINVPHWSRELNGFRIAAISDIHGGSNYSNEERLRYLTQQVNAQNPDVIFLLGDFVSQTAERKSPLKMSVETIAENIKGMKAKYGVYAVIGNHDWWYDDAKVRTALENVGIKVLENQTASFSANGQTVTILGIEDFWRHKSVPINDIMSKIETPQNLIAITHNPDSFDQTPDSIALVLAGHTHGGQVLIPFYGAPVLVAQRKYTAHHIVENGRNLFVTTGFGTTGPQLRFGVPPEIAVITLNGTN